MHFGEPIDEDRFVRLIQLAYDSGIRTFLTADVYGAGAADTLLGKALAGLPRESYCLIGAVGHDFYHGKREGSKGFPRFTDPSLRAADGYLDYLRFAVDKSLERCGATQFDLLLLHNPDLIGYSKDSVWNAMVRLKEERLTAKLGVAPGPANGFTLDLIQCFERFHECLDWAMIILNPLEPWPGQLVLPAAERFDIDLITRVVDYGGLFHDDVQPGHTFATQDHRAFRPAGWVEAGIDKMEQMRPIAQSYGLTMMQLACIWNLSWPKIKSVVPTFIQEIGPNTKAIEDKVREVAQIPDLQLREEDRQRLLEIGQNKGCMQLKGARADFTGDPLPDQWRLTPELEQLARRWGIDPHQDLAYSHSA